MNQSTLAMPTLASVLWPQSAEFNLPRAAVLAVAGALLLWLTARIQIPFFPVPMTMQTLAVLLIGIAYGWRLGGTTVLVYLLAGAGGLPVFAQGGGLAYMMGPTAGYLIGFYAAAVVMGFLAERGWDRLVVTTILAMIVGELLIFGFGVAWLGNVIGYDKAVAAGVTPFIPAEIFKIALATVLLPAVWRFVNKRS